MKLPIFDYYEMLSREEKKAFRMEVCRRCNIEAHQFYRRMRTESWSKLEEREIERILSDRENANGEARLNSDSL